MIGYLFRWLQRKPAAEPVLAGNCPIREHTGDGAYIGRCDFAIYSKYGGSRAPIVIYDEICPRHGLLADYPNLDDRDVDPRYRRF